MSPLFEFARGELNVSPEAWYLAKVALTYALLRESQKYEGFTSAHEVVHETLARIHAGGEKYRRVVSPEGVAEPLDDFVLRCLQKTISSLRSQEAKARKRKIHDESIRQLHHREHVAREPQQEVALAEEQAQREINKILEASRSGPLLREQASHTLEWSQQKLTNEEIAALLQTKVANVDKNRSRLAALIAAKTKTTEVSP